jgi:hypothetical protein
MIIAAVKDIHPLNSGMVWPTADCEALGFQRRRMAYTAESTELHAVVLLCDARGSDEDGFQRPAKINVVSAAATHTPLLIWVKRYRWIPCLCRPMFVVAPRTIIQGESAK